MSQTGQGLTLAPSELRQDGPSQFDHQRRPAWQPV